MSSRKKASDVFRETEYVFARKGTFQEAFPGIRTLRLVVTERGDYMWDKPGRERVYTETHTPSEFFDCSNPLCYNGGVSLGQILRYMVASKLTHHETQEVCRGYEGSPKGRRKYRSCMHAFKVTIDLEYSEA